MNQFDVAVKFRVCTTVSIEANSLEEAIALAKKEEFDLPPTDEWEYIDNTFEVDEETTIAYN